MKLIFSISSNVIMIILIMVNVINIFSEFHKELGLPKRRGVHRRATPSSKQRQYSKNGYAKQHTLPNGTPAMKNGGECPGILRLGLSNTCYFLDRRFCRQVTFLSIRGRGTAWLRCTWGRRPCGGSTGAGAGAWGET